MFQRTTSWILVALVFAVVVGIPASATFTTDLWWFQHLGFERVFWVSTGAQAAMGLGGGLLAFFAIWVNVRAAMRAAPVPRARLSTDVTDNPLGGMIASIPPDLLAFGLSAVVGLLVGGAVSTWWPSAILAIYGGDFGFTDPVFGLDARVYAFVLPLVLEGRGSLMALIVICTLATTAVYLSRGAVKVQLEEVEGQFVAKGATSEPSSRPGSC